jgi:hypothetical protein
VGRLDEKPAEESSLPDAPKAQLVDGEVKSVPATFDAAHVFGRIQPGAATRDDHLAGVGPGRIDLPSVVAAKPIRAGGLLGGPCRDRTCNLGRGRPSVSNRLKGGRYRSSAGQNARARDSGCPAGASQTAALDLRLTSVSPVAGRLSSGSE